MSKLAANKAAKQRAIIDAARAQFLTGGYGEASMDAIAAAAGVTKQTVYRYFPSKDDLFEATLKDMGNHTHDHLTDLAANPDTAAALEEFALGFVKGHLTQTHLDTVRLLITEAPRAPHLLQLFNAIGRIPTTEQLATFFADRFHVEDPVVTVDLWASMLLTLRHDVLVGAPYPSEDRIRAHARNCTAFLLAALEPK